MSEGLSAEERQRVASYIKLTQPFQVKDGVTLEGMPFRHSYYYFDLRRLMKHFPAGLKINFEFGDVSRILSRPTIVKSRPIGDENGNNVLLKLDSFRHFSNLALKDSLSFEEKRPIAVWRGAMLRNPQRAALARQFSRNPRHDIGYTTGSLSLPDVPPKPYQEISEQRRKRYIISVEGNDVATNLKWIMASNSLCLMPRPKYETWFLEGQLRPGVHYAELSDDFSNLDELVSYYNERPKEALEIISNAHRYVAPFTDEARELSIQLVVLQEYFRLSGQLSG